MFTHVVDFFQRQASLKKTDSKTFFISLLKDLLIEDFGTLKNLLSTKFMEPRKWPYVTLGIQAWVSQP